MKNIGKKILNVQSNLGAIKKSGYNSHQKYHYSTEQDINAAVRPQLIANNIAHTWSVESVEFLSNGQFAIATTVHTFLDADSGEQIEIKSVGTGADKGDKAVYKAFTGASKYAFAKMFLIATDDDPENDEATPTSKPNTTTSSKPAAKKPSSGGGIFGGKSASSAPKPESKPPAPSGGTFGTKPKVTTEPIPTKSVTKAAFGARVITPPKETKTKQYNDEDIGF